MLRPLSIHCSQFLKFASRFCFSRAKKSDAANESLRVRRKFAPMHRMPILSAFYVPFGTRICSSLWQSFLSFICGSS